MAKSELTKIIKTPRLSKLASRYIAQLVGKRDRDSFYLGEPIEVNQEQFDKLKKKGWCLIWRNKDGN